MKINFVRFFRYIKKAIRSFIVIRPFDKICPFGGELASNNGVFQKHLSENHLEALLGSYLRNKHQLSNPIFGEDEKESIIYVLSQVSSIIRDYLGNGSYIDTMFFEESSKNNVNNNFSASWHTDNVGARIKVFVCLKGNGSFPTYFIPSKNRIPSLKEWFKNSVIESLRWMGFKVQCNLPLQTKILHTKGSLSIFDTNLLHRASSEGSDYDRVTFQLEFSRPEKHKLLFGSVGTNQNNSFHLDQSYISNEIIMGWLDPLRIIGGNKILIYSNANK